MRRRGDDGEAGRPSPGQEDKAGEIRGSWRRIQRRRENKTTGIWEDGLAYIPASDGQCCESDDGSRPGLLAAHPLPSTYAHSHWHHPSIGKYLGYSEILHPLSSLFDTVITLPIPTGTNTTT